MATLWAISDLHVSHRGNEEMLDRIRPAGEDDWLIVAGDVAERTDDIVDTLRRLAARFEKVLWVPGNHELYTTAKDPLQIFGVARYDYLVQACREIGVVTPEDIYPLFDPRDGSSPVRIVPMFLLYDYTFRPEGTVTALQALAVARDRNVVATDEFLLSPEPFGTRDAWGRDRIAQTVRRLEALDPAEKTVLINHWPLRREPCDVLMYPEFALWCGSELTADWHTRFNAMCSVYGHLHIPRTTWYDDVRFEEVSVGYPREWKRRGLPEPLLRQIVPDPGTTPEDVPHEGLRFEVPPDYKERAAEFQKKLDERRDRQASRGST
ncbi:metallophosphoesterase [Gordonia sp. HY002]|uniref:metallophosphoesterase family protein n=1 Tax=Gordonia zhenghanii TaxID=2911516 RepID=UPI001EF0010B|nr:metallophosphoesterase [Gordonia zhenghanii]MCF8569590.1 metallophosphoesterase [Gordonia zhenghanii]MCF8602889.1 metallophosphoesterase [Gordonia zhenghanii]